jgi:hypothetical protein
LFSGCRHAHAEGAVGSAAMRSLRRADLDTEEIAYRVAQNLSSLRRAPTVARNPSGKRPRDRGYLIH